MTLKDVGGFYPVIKALIQEFDRETALVYGVVWGYSNMKDEDCWASESTIAREAGMGVSTVSTRLDKLVEFGYLTKQSELGHTTHYEPTSKIRINLSFVKETSLPDTEGSLPDNDVPRCETTTIKRVNRLTNSVTQHTPEENLYFSVTKQWPRKAQREVVIDLIKASTASYDELLRGYKAWVGKGWSPYNLDWIKYSKTGIPAYQKPAPVDHDREGYV
jgi:hypothetical protein